MSLVHHQSRQSIHSGLDLFSVAPTQTSVEEGQFVEHHPLATLSPYAPIEFSISGATADYIDLSNTFLHLQVKITNPDGTDLAQDAHVGPVNYWMNSLFSQVDMTLNGTLVTSSENTYPYRAYIESTLDYGVGAKQSHLSSSLYYKDTSAQMEATHGRANVGFGKRSAHTSESKVVDMMGRLHIDFFHQRKYLINGVDVKIRLIPSKAPFHLMSEVVGARTLITHASLYVRKAKINPSIALAHAKTLEKTTCKYILKRVVCKTFSIPTGNFSIVQDNLFLSQTPTRIIVGLVDSAAFNGDYLRNPFNFKHMSLNFLGVYIDGRQVPAKPLTPDFPNRQFIRSYFNSVVGLGLADKNEDNFITREDFADGYALYCFDLSPSLIDGDAFELLKTSSLRLELKFAQALTAPATVIVYGELDSVVEIDKSRQVLTDFSS